MSFEPSVHAAGWAFLVLFGLFIPYLAVKSAARVATGALPPKRRYFTSVIFQLWIFGGIAAAVGMLERVVLFPRAWPPASSWALGAIVLAGLVAFMRPRWRKRVEERTRKVWLYMPNDGVERALWLGASISAGVAEELVYRGVMFALLWRLTSSPVAAALVSAAIFAVSHYLQGWASMAVIFAMALIVQALAWHSGSLYVSMAVHALYDVCAGLYYGRYGKLFGYPRDAPPAEATA